MPPKLRLLGEIFVTWVPVQDPEYIPDHNKTNMNIKLRCSFQASPHQYKSLLWFTKSRRYQGEKTKQKTKKQTNKQKTSKKTLRRQFVNNRSSIISPWKATVFPHMWCKAHQTLKVVNKINDLVENQSTVLYKLLYIILIKRTSTWFSVHIL